MYDYPIRYSLPLMLWWLMLSTTTLSRILLIHNQKVWSPSLFDISFWNFLFYFFLYSRCTWCLFKNFNARWKDMIVLDMLNICPYSLPPNTKSCLLKCLLFVALEFWYFIQYSNFSNHLTAIHEFMFILIFLVDLIARHCNPNPSNMESFSRFITIGKKRYAMNMTARCLWIC